MYIVNFFGITLRYNKPNKSKNDISIPFIALIKLGFSFIPRVSIF